MLRNILIGVLTLGMLPLFGCAKTYRIMYDNCERAFINPAEKARAGKTVTLKMGVVTDTRTEVLLDGEPLQPTGEKNGFLLYTFKMPAHDVTLSVTSQNISAVEKRMLLDYYTASAAVDEAPGEEEGYYELVLYDDDCSDLLLEEYCHGGTSNETVESCRVPRETAGHAKEIIMRYRMVEWKRMDDCDSLEGVIYVCRFNLEGTYYRVTSEHMPQDGMDAFREVRELLQSAKSGS
jgi:hypothetical protein